MANTVAANSISWFADNAHNETVLYVNTTAAANHVDMEIHLTGTNINLTGSDILHHTSNLRERRRLYLAAEQALLTLPLRAAATNCGIHGII